MRYNLADLELNLAERRLDLQTAALDVMEQRDELRDQSAEDLGSSQQERRLWWRYY